MSTTINTTYQRRRERGLCVHCEEPSATFRCTRCRAALNERVNAMRANRRDAGLCPYCGCGQCLCPRRRRSKPKRLKKKESITWIPVADEVPDEGLSVLVACGIADTTMFDVFEAVLNDGTWTGPSGEYMEQRVQFWAEMPEGPSGDT